MAHHLDPTSQLWAKQIKREHGFLHKKTKDLEVTAKNHEDRITAVEKVVKATPADAGGSLKVQTVDTSAVKERIDGMEKSVNVRIGEIEADGFAMTKVLDGLQRDKQVAEEERKATLTKDKALLKRIGEVEEGLRKYEKNLGLIGKSTDGTMMETIKKQLEDLTKDVKGEGEKFKHLEQSVASLETANDAIVKANEKLERRLNTSEAKVAEQEARLSEKPTIAGADEPSSPEDSASASKKSHKWAGGGADRDIIKQGEELFGIKRVPKPAAPTSQPETTSPKKIVPKPIKKTSIVKKRNPVPKAKTDGSSRKSHKWAGGGADRDIIAQGVSQETKYGYDQVWTDATAVTPTVKSQASSKRYEDGKEVVRSGRGWYEVERSPTPDEDGASPPPPRDDWDYEQIQRMVMSDELEKKHASARKSQSEPKPKRVKKPIEYNEDGTPIKRPRGRPRKYPRPEEIQAQSMSNSARSSLAPPPANLTKKRSADSAFEFDVPDDSVPPAKKSKISNENGKSESPAPSVPESTVAPRRIIYATHKAQEAPYVGAPVAPVAQMAPSKPSRRQIPQLDDDGMETVIRRMQP